MIPRSYFLKKLAKPMLELHTYLLRFPPLSPTLNEPLNSYFYSTTAPGRLRQRRHQINQHSMVKLGLAPSENETSRKSSQGQRRPTIIREKLFSAASSRERWQEMSAVEEIALPAA